MNEREWVESIIERIETASKDFISKDLRVTDGRKLPYANEILSYKGTKPSEQHLIRYETDILVYEQINEEEWKPRIIIEAKKAKITTHDSITYSNKAQTHKQVHPYLRYGVLIGDRKHYPLPGRLFRHGQQFDFMQSWETLTADSNEWSTFIDILKLEYEASVALDEIIFNSRSSNRDWYTSLHKPLNLR